jgi:hypothetical protein
MGFSNLPTSSARVFGITHSKSEALPSSRSLLVDHELVGASEEDFARPVLPNFAAQGTLDGNRLKGKLLPAGRHVAAAPLARHNEGLAISGCQEHASMIGK